MPAGTANAETHHTETLDREAAITAHRDPVRVLVVDDDEVIRTLVRALLDDPAFEIDEAADGPEALERAAQSRPDVVLLDVMMPGMDGFEVCRAIRETPSLTELPVVMLTAKDGAADRERGMAAGADVYLTKPFSALELIDVVHGIVDRRRDRGD